MNALKKRTIQPAAGPSRITPEQAYEAARYVYRDSNGKRVISKFPPPPKKESRSRKAGTSKR